MVIFSKKGGAHLENIISVHNLRKVYRIGNEKIVALITLIWIFPKGRSAAF
jgi:hypothetical protein